MTKEVISKMLETEIWTVHGLFKTLVTFHEPISSTCSK